jgi:acetolactate synthase-1/2/3 large subunit
MQQKPSRKILDAKTGGHWFTLLLKDLGVQFVFGTTGAGMPDIQDAMVVVKPPKWIQGLHEFVSVSAAVGYSLASGSVGVALIDRVVGTQNALGALYAASQTFAPVVVFASENVPGVPIPTGEPEYHYHSGMLGLASTWAKWATRVESLGTLAYDVRRAFEVASSEPRGPVYVTLRQDLMAQGVDGAYGLTPSSTQVGQRVPDDQTCHRIVELILSHQNPCVLVSHAGRRPEAVKALVDFAHVLGLGVVERRVFMNYPMGDAHHLGFASGMGFEGLPPDVDLLILLEAGLIPHIEPPVDQVIDISTDPVHRQDVYEGGDYGGAVDWSTLRAVCDTAPTLAKLTGIAERLIGPSDREAIGDRSAEIAQKHKEYYGHWWTHSQENYERGVLDGYSVGYALNRHWGDGLVWVNGAITPRDGLLKNIVLNEPQTYFSNPSGHLGVTVGMAYGVCLADKYYGEVADLGGYSAGRILGGKNTVICTLGDGEAMFGNIGSALWTVSHYGLPVVYVVLNNACWAVEWPPIERSPQHWAKLSSDFEFIDLDQPRIGFSKMAEAFGVHSSTATTVDELDDAIHEALGVASGGRPALIDVQLPKASGPKQSAVP